MANQDRVNFIWGEDALTTIPSVPVSEVAYRDTSQTPEQMAEGQKYDTIYNSARYNQLLFLLTSVAKTLCENGMMPFLAGQAYNQYARCLFTDGKIYSASRAIAANESPYPTPGDDSFVWIKEGGGGGTPAGAVVPFYNVTLGGTGNRYPIFWGQSEHDPGWLICDGGSDGSSGTVPDLREKFIMGATGTSDAGIVGGASSATPTININNTTQGGSLNEVTVTASIRSAATGLTVNARTITIDTMPQHNHSITACRDNGSSSVTPLGPGDTTNVYQQWTGYTGGNGGHDHGVTDPTHTHTVSISPHTHTFTGAAHNHTATISAVSTLPPYYKLIYCVKLPE